MKILFYHQCYEFHQFNPLILKVSVNIFCLFVLILLDFALKVP